VKDGTGAAKAGIKAGGTQVVVSGESWILGGDVLISADGMKLASLADLQRAVVNKKPGQRIEVELYRGEEKKTVMVALSRRTD
jgi:serine protease Do